MISCFENKYAFLSNFFISPISYNNQTYTCLESAFQAQKVLDLGERSKFENINPSQAKSLGRKVKLREDWEQVKDTIMYDLCRIKFSDPILSKLLLDTKDEELVEGNWWKDTYWGVYKGFGLNTLGKILMRIRDEIKGDKIDKIY
jgi:ribA/ribD-fused uncharacterized protein